MLCLNDSFFFLEPIVVSEKEKKKGGGGGSVRSLRLKNWLPLESTILYKVVRSQHLNLKICYFVNLDHSFY